MTIELIHFIVLWLNAFPVRSGISTKYSPRELVQRHQLSAKTHCKTPFGTYCEVHDEPDPSNGMNARTHETICMGPTGNAQGSYKFYCLRTRQKLTQRRWDELPMPCSIIKRVHRHAKADKMTKGLSFRDRNNSLYQFENKECNEVPERLVEEEPAPYPYIPEELPGVETQENHEGVTPALIEDTKGGEASALAAARNANITHGHDMLEEGPMVIEPDEESHASSNEPEVIDGPDDEPSVVTIPNEPEDEGTVAELENEESN